MDITVHARVPRSESQCRLLRLVVESPEVALMHARPPINHQDRRQSHPVLDTRCDVMAMSCPSREPKAGWLERVEQSTGIHQRSRFVIY